VFSFHLLGQNVDSTKVDTSFFKRLHYRSQKAAMKKMSPKFQRAKKNALQYHSVHDTGRFNILKINPLIYLTGVANISFERKFYKQLSIESRISYVYLGYFRVAEHCPEGEMFVLPTFRSYEIIPVKGFSVSIGPKVYGRAYNAMSGFYFNFQFEYKYYSSSKFNHWSIKARRIVRQNRNIYGVKFIWGEQFILKSNITFDLFFGFGMRFYRITEKVYYSKDYYEIVEECSVNEDKYTEDFSTRSNFTRKALPTIHLGIKMGFAF